MNELQAGFLIVYFVGLALGLFYAGYFKDQAGEVEQILTLVAAIFWPGTVILFIFILPFMMIYYAGEYYAKKKGAKNHEADLHERD